MDRLTIGIDIGTTAIKLTVMDERGVSLINYSYKNEYDRPHEDWAEIDPENWYLIVKEALIEICQKVPKDRVKGIGITGQMHTTIFLDKNGESIRPAILWNDGRTKNLLSDLKSQLRMKPETTAIANIVSTGSPLANLLWLKEYEYESYLKIAKILITKDYLVYKLTGTYSTDHCDASTSSMYDLSKREWSDTIRKMFDFSTDIFPPINSSSMVVGNLTDNLSDLLGLSNDILVVAGTGDNAASAIAGNCFLEDQPLISLGTSGVVVVPSKKNQMKNVGKNIVLQIIENEERIITQGTVQAGAKVNSWWMEKIVGSNNYTEQQQRISHEYLGRNSILFFPHLNGEKTLFAQPTLRGAFVGLGLETTRDEMYLAILEGVAFGIKQLYEQVKNIEPAEYFTIVGGGSRSELWVKIFANVLNTPIRQLTQAREAVHGAALLAHIGIGKSKVSEDQQYIVIQPDESIAHEYELKYKHYQKMAAIMLEYYSEETNNG